MELLYSAYILYLLYLLYTHVYQVVYVLYTDMYQCIYVLYTHVYQCVYYCTKGVLYVFFPGEATSSGLIGGQSYCIYSLCVHFSSAPQEKTGLSVSPQGFKQWKGKKITQKQLLTLVRLQQIMLEILRERLEGSSCSQALITFSWQLLYLRVQ